MHKDTYRHIKDNIQSLEMDLINGVILNRKCKSKTQGYLTLKLNGRLVRQHQIFAVARWDDECIGMTINHKNKIRHDNSFDNLELLTLSENIALANLDRGEPVKSINLETGEEIVFNSQKEAGRYLKLSQGNISNYLKGSVKSVKKKYKFEKVGI